MMGPIKLKEALERYYVQFDSWILMGLKALTALLVFVNINTRIGFLEQLNNPLLILGMVLLCSFLPWNTITVFAAFLTVGHLYGTSLEFAVAAALLFLLLALLLASFRVKNSIFLVLVPLCFQLHMPFAVPVIAGLSMNLLALLPVAGGCVVYFFLKYAAGNMDALAAAGEEELTETANRYVSLLNGFLRDREMLLFTVAFILTVLIVYIVRNMAMNYNWELAAGLGLGVLFLSLMAGNAVLSAGTRLPELLLSLVGSGLVVYVYLLLFHNADYRSTERLRFEDDDYFYYVKAVPKMRSERKEGV